MRAPTILCSCVLFAAACAGRGASPTATTADATPGEPDDRTPALRLGHYSTGDGMHGLVIDRTGERAKIRIDGDAAIIELTARPGDSRDTQKLVDPTGKPRLAIDERGGVVWLDHGKDVFRDGDANALGAATVAGDAPAPKPTAWDVGTGKLAAIAVVERIEGMRPADAGDLDKVRAAIQKADRDMFVHVKSTLERDAYSPVSRWLPDGRHGDTTFGRSDRAASSSGIGKHGGVLAPLTGADQSGWIEVYGDKDLPRLAASTPGLVWDADGSYVSFVTLDGGRYQVEWSELELGLPDASTWPAPLQHTLLGNDDVDYLVRAGVLPKSVYEPIDRSNTAFRTCVQDGWKRAEAQFDALAKKDLDWSTRAHRGKVLREKTQRELASKTCKKHLDAFEAALVKVIDERAGARKALAEAAKTKLAR